MAKEPRNYLAPYPVSGIAAKQPVAPSAAATEAAILDQFPRQTEPESQWEQSPDFGPKEAESEPEVAGGWPAAGY